MAKYLVDYENVKCDGLMGIDQLSENDQVIVFYSINADRITFDLHNLINASKADIKFYNINVGSKNALDFQLATALGYLIAKDTNDKFVIVTKDKDYSVVVSFWSQMNVDVTIKNNLKVTTEENNVYIVEDEQVVEQPKQETVSKVVKEKKKSKSKSKSSSVKKKEKTQEIILNDQQLATEIYNLVNDQQKALLLASYIEKYKTKLGVNNAIVKEYGTKVGGQLYKTIKPLISDKKGN